MIFVVKVPICGILKIHPYRYKDYGIHAKYGRLSVWFLYLPVLLLSPGLRIQVNLAKIFQATFVPKMSPTVELSASPQASIFCTPVVIPLVCPPHYV
jgi:hypothetical protein